MYRYACHIIENHRELEEDLEIRRFVLERRGLKVSRSKTEYLKVGNADVGEELKSQGVVAKRAKNFKYLGSTKNNDERCEEKVRKRKDPSRLDELKEGF